MKQSILAILLSLLLAGGVLAQDTSTDTTDTTETETTEPTDTAEPVDPAADPLAEPTEDPLADPAEDPLAEPTEDPLADPAEDPLADPVEDPLADPAEDPLADPAAEPVDPAADPAAADPVAGDAAGVEGGTILDTLAADPEFSTLVSAVQAAGLESTLAGEGPFTVFAPTNAAFDAVAPEELDALLADPVALQAVLLNHVVAGEYLAADVSTLPSVTTMQMEDVTIATDGAGGVTVGDATVVQPDITAANGVVHAIDAIILPQAAAGLQ